MRAAALALAILAFTVAAQPVHKCAWAGGSCIGSPGHLLNTFDSLKPTTPQQEHLLNVFAIEATCETKATKKTCGDTKFCLWNINETPKCSANLEKLNDVLGDLAKLTGCPGSLAATVASCNAAAEEGACLAMKECGWIEGEDIPTATSESKEGVRKRFVRRRLSARATSPMMMANTSSDYYDEIVAGPRGKPLAGCHPAKLAALVKAKDVPSLEQLIERIDQQDPEVYGHCEDASQEVLSECGRIEAKQACIANGKCAWDETQSDEPGCYATQAAMMASIFGAGSKAAAATHACGQHATAGACFAAGVVDFDVERVRDMLPPHDAVEAALNSNENYQQFGPSGRV